MINYTSKLFFGVALCGVFSQSVLADPNALYIDSESHVGVGTGIPASKLHVWGDSSDESDVQVLVENLNTADPGTARALFVIKNDGPARFGMWSSPTDSWVFNARDDGFRISKQGTGNLEMEVSDTGNLTISGALTEGSSRTIKTDIVEVDATAILDKVVSLPVARWSYTRDSDGIRHLGPMAEDFYEAFELGHTNRGIASVDSSGVALAAIKGLKQEKDHEIDTIRAEKNAEIAALKAELHQLRAEQDERMMQLEMALAEVLRNQSSEDQVGSAN